MSESVLRNINVGKKSKAREWTENVILALQHLIAMFGATVLVPMLTGFDPSVALVCAGVGTLLFHLVTKGKVPVFLGSSFAFIGVIVSVKEAYNGDLSYAQGGIIIAGLIYVLASFCVKKVGVDKIQKLLPPHVVGAMIIVIGLNLVPVALNMAKGNLIVAAITLGTTLIINIFGQGFFKKLSIMIGITTGCLVSLGMGLMNTAAVTEAAVFQMPGFNLPKFSTGAIVVIAPVVLAVFMEHLGDITSNGAVVGKNFIEDPGLNRTLLGDGLATMFAGFMGGPANTTYGENTGVLALTKNYNPAILRLAAVFAIMIGFLGKVGGVLKCIPTFVMGGISLMLFSSIALVGVQTIKNNNVKFNVKNSVVMGVIVIMGLYGTYLQKPLENFLNVESLNMAIQFTDSVAISGLSLAAIVGVALNWAINRFNKEKTSILN